MQRIRPAIENILGSKLTVYGCLARSPSCPHLCWPSYWRSQKVHRAVSEMWRYSILLASIRIESTDGNFGTHEKVAITIPIVTCTLPIPIPIFGIFVSPFPWENYGNLMGMGIPVPCTSLVRTHTCNSRTDSRRTLKLGGGVKHMTRRVWPLTKVKRPKVKVTRSRNVSAAITL